MNFLTAHCILSVKIMQPICFIPARFGSKRFPGKPLAKILGKSLIQLTWENARQSSVNPWILTDDIRIFEHVKDFGGNVLMTPQECRSGTERIAWTLMQDGAPQGDIIVNIQGDEPCMPPEAIEKAVALLLDDPSLQMATAVTEIPREKGLSENIVKCVFDAMGNALYFSRSLIPSRTERVFKHLGLYVYRRTFLPRLFALPETPLQQAEDLEQLKALEHGVLIRTCIVDDFGPAVDVPEDIQTTETYLCRKNTSLLQAGSALL